MAAARSRRLVPASLLLAGLLVGPTGGYAQQPAPAGRSLVEAAARRFPQPVRVGDLLQRRVLQPLESQPTLGWVREVVRRTDGSVHVVLDCGGVLGFFARPIAIPVEAMALLGQYMEVVDLTPEQLARFERFSGAGATPLPRDSIVRVGLARPTH